MEASSDLRSQRENRCADCLFLDLKVATGDSLRTEQVGIHLTLNFHEQWKTLPLGRVKFGLRGGELRLKVDNGIVPYENRDLVKALPISVSKSYTLTSNLEVQHSNEFSVSNSGASAKVGAGRKKVSGRTEASEVVSCQVSSKGSDIEPAWAFALKALDEDVLIGYIDCHLCRVNIKGIPCKLEAIFQVSKSDVWILDTEGIWPSNISQNRKAIIERELVFYLLKNHIHPYISRVFLPLVTSLSSDQ